ncbi:MAG TPA: c-type cytochrome [Devosia sp.]|nr:c-type cytochrome [Devosia sp.]
MFRIAMVVAATLAGAGGALAQGDVALGQLVFEDKCASCHTAGGGEAKRGPDLANIIGRPAGTVEGYKYSDALLEAAAAGLVWDIETLDRFITKPRKVVNGSFMNFTGISNPDDVANVIAYLVTLSTPAQ